VEYKPVQYAKNDYRVLKKENRYTGTFMIRQKSNGFFIPDEKISVDMDIVISSLKVPYLRFHIMVPSSFLYVMGKLSHLY